MKIFQLFENDTEKIVQPKMLGPKKAGFVEMLDAKKCWVPKKLGPKKCWFNKMLGP